jgi:hypothetical protein
MSAAAVHHNAAVQQVEHRVKARNGWTTVGRHVATCTCGVRSRPAADPDVAQRAADRHNARTR